MEKILIIEDDLEITKNLRILLEEEGFIVCSVMSRKEALQEIDHVRYDLILLDLMLPDGSGYTLCTSIKRKREIPVIFLTAMNDEASIVTGFDLDVSFENYCRCNGISEDSNVVLINKIWNSTNSDRVHRAYIPFIREEPFMLKIKNSKALSEEYMDIEISSFVQEMPVIKEEYQQFSLTLIISENTHQVIEENYPVSESYYNIRTYSDEQSLNVRENIETLLKGKEGYVISSRLEDENSDVKIRGALRLVITALAGVLAYIGISNVFSSTLGQIYQRKKEFARYLSVGLSPKRMIRILVLESCLIGLKPVILSIIINIPLVAIALNAASITSSEFLINAPVVPITLFACFYLCFIWLAYYLGGKRILTNNLIDVLKDETMI